MNFDPITLALANEYTDEKVASSGGGGGGGGGEIPVIDLVALGITKAMSLDGDIANVRLEDEVKNEVISKMRTGIVRVKFMFGMEGAEASAEGVFNTFAAEAASLYQGISLVYMNNPLLLAVSLQGRNLSFACQSFIALS